MLVEIWSDVACPFCWLGKHRFERALAGFGHRDRVSVVWRSFQLDPSLKTDPAVRVDEHLARKKGIDRHTAAVLNARIAQAGRLVGLDYDFDRLIVSNTFDAHRLIQLAKARGKQNAAEERLFRAYFAEGKNVADHATLADLAAEIGIERDAAAEALANGSHAGDVRADIAEARQLGINGVPFFMLDRKFAVSGAQDPAAFTQALAQAFADGRGDWGETASPFS